LGIDKMLKEIPPTKQTVSFLVLSFFLAVVSSWPPADHIPFVRTILYALFSFAIFLVFGYILPRRLSLAVQILFALISGIIAGQFLRITDHSRLATDGWGIIGTLFLLVLKLPILPLIFVSIVCGVVGIGDFKRLGAVGTKTILYYLGTTALAILLGLVLVNIVPFDKVPKDNTHTVSSPNDSSTQSFGRKIQKEILPHYLKSPIMTDQNPLTVILFGIMMGIALGATGTKAQPVIEVFRGLDTAFAYLIQGIMQWAPLGVFALMTHSITEQGIEYLIVLARCFLTVITGLLLHFGILIFVLLPVLGKFSPRQFLKGIAPAIEMAFSTSSSNATLPVSLECMARRVGTDSSVTHFMLPLGATINMDGTALYVAVASVFVARVYDVPLGLSGQLVIFWTALLVSIGTAGVPGASIGLLGVIFQATGIPLEGISIILGVDRILDMCRTVVNITGDCVGVVVVSHSEGLAISPRRDTVEENHRE